MDVAGENILGPNTTAMEMCTPHTLRQAAHGTLPRKYKFSERALR